MKEHEAILALPRTESHVYGELLAAEQMYRMLHACAMEYVNLDMRPLRIIEGHVEHIGPSPIPDNLQRELWDAGDRYGRLRAEYALSRLTMRDR